MREVISRVRIGKEMGKGFWMAREVTHGCPLNPILFNIILADFEEEMGRGEIAGGRVYTLTYANDLVLLAKGKEEMRSMKVGGLLG